MSQARLLKEAREDRWRRLLTPRTSKAGPRVLTMHVPFAALLAKTPVVDLRLTHCFFFLLPLREQHVAERRLFAFQMMPLDPVQIFWDQDERHDTNKTKKHSRRAANVVEWPNRFVPDTGPILEHA